MNQYLEVVRFVFLEGVVVVAVAVSVGTAEVVAGSLFVVSAVVAFVLQLVSVQLYLKF